MTIREQLLNEVKRQLIGMGAEGLQLEMLMDAYEKRATNKELHTFIIS